MVDNGQASPKPNRRYRVGLIILGLAVAGYLVWNDCEACYSDEMGTVVPATLPQGCGEVQMPSFHEEATGREPIQLPDGREERYDHLALRKSAASADTYMVALGSTIKVPFGSDSVEGHFSQEKWAMAVPRNVTTRTLTQPRRAQDQEWAAGQPLALMRPSYWPERFRNDGRTIWFQGHGFPHKGSYFLSGAPVLSANDRWLTVVSGSGWYGGSSPVPTIELRELVYHPARYFWVTTYEAASGRQVSEVHGWGCFGLFGLRDGTAWYGDELLMMPTDERGVIVCRF